MDKLIKNTPPVWIFGLTLLAIVVTGPLVGTSPCERAIKECYTEGVGMDSDRTSLQQACAQAPCEVKKRGALVPLAILIAGLVIVKVWFRQNAPSNTPGQPGSVAAPARSRSGDHTSGDRREPRESQPSKAAPARRATDQPGIKSAVKKTSARKSKPAPSAAVEPAGKQPGSDKSPALGEQDQSFCLAVLSGPGDQSRDALTASLARLLGTPGSEEWKSVRLADMDLLTKALAAGALFGATAERYGRGLRGDSNAGLPVSDELQQQTKKSLVSHCQAILKGDMQGIARNTDYLTDPGHAAVLEIANALADEGALSGLTKCGKEGLLRLAVVIA